VHRSFEQQPFAQFDALQRAEPLLLLAAALLELLLEFVMPDDDDMAELSDPPDPLDPPDPPEPLPLLVMVSKSSPVAQAANTSGHTAIKSIFFIWAPWGFRPY
jgi:hypothetical protein